MLAALLVTVALPTAPAFELYDPYTFANGVSKNGRFVCGSNWDGQSWIVAMWERGEMTTSFATASLGDSEKAVSISDNGEAAVIVEKNKLPSASQFRGFRWTQGKRPVSLQLLPGTLESWPRAISRDGKVIVGTVFSKVMESPVSWKPDCSISKLPNVDGPKSLSGEALNVSSDGRVAVGRLTADKKSQPAVWKAGKVALIGSLPNGKQESYAWACSLDGSVVAGFGNDGKRIVPMIWTRQGGMKKLGEMPSEFKTGMARGMSDDGKTIVGLWGAGKDGKGFVWTSSGGLSSVEDFLKKHGLNKQIAGLKLNSVMGVSGDGRTIVGVCTDSEKRTRGFKASF